MRAVVKMKKLIGSYIYKSYTFFALLDLIQTIPHIAILADYLKLEPD